MSRAWVAALVLVLGASVAVGDGASARGVLGRYIQFPNPAPIHA